MKTEIKTRIDRLRRAMALAGVDATIIPRTDPHQSEYLADHWQSVRWLTGFTGSAGTLVVTGSDALFWTDSRYFLQAADQLDGSGITLMRDGLPDTPSIEAYLTDNLSAGNTIGIDGMLFSIARTDALREQFEPLGVKIMVDFDPIDELWTDRPPLPDGKIFVHDTRYAGRGAAAKIADVRAEVESAGAVAVFISDLAEIAWVLNIRCDDVACNPVATAFLYIGRDEVVLFTDPAKVDQPTAAYLAENGVSVRNYTDVKQYLSWLPAAVKVLLPTQQSAGQLVSILGDRAVAGGSPVAMLKAVKNDVQIAGVRAAMVRDGVAMVRAMVELEQRLGSGVRTTEMDVDRILTHHRSAQPLYFDNSFDTIAGYGPHGAIVHYEATEQTDAEIIPGNLLLIDSGAQYLDGTTDITRTIAIGEPTAEQRRDFTLVMKGHIALASAVYPAGTRGVQLDVLARQYLWKEGLTFLHGTGHGVGQFLNVHEGPQSIRMNDTFAPLVPGMITSNEPGLYRSGKWGIRCENLILTTEAMTTDYGSFLRFETLTLFPFDLKLFDTSMMTADEIAWVNDYHTQVRTALMPALDIEAERKWLELNTQTLN